MINDPDQRTITTDTLYLNTSFQIVINEHHTILSTKLFFNKNPTALLWLFVLIAFSSISFALILPSTQLLHRAIVKAKNKKATRGILFGSCVMVIVVYLLSVQSPYFYSASEMLTDCKVLLAYPLLDLLILFTVPLIVGMICISGLIISAFTISSLNPNYENINDNILKFRKLKNQVNQFLSILGLVYSTGAVIGTAILERALNELFIGRKHIDFFPPQAVIVYAMLFTFFIVIIYSPIYFLMIEKGKRILETKNPINLDQYKLWQETQTGLEEYLGLKLTLKENLSNSLIILSPFISGVLSQLLPVHF